MTRYATRSSGVFSRASLRSPSLGHSRFGICERWAGGKKLTISKTRLTAGSRRCGFRPASLHTRCTASLLTPSAAASLRQLQRVEPSFGCLRVAERIRANNRATFFPRALSIRSKPLRRSSRGGEEEFFSFRLKSFRDSFFSWNALTIAGADLPNTDLTLTQTRQSKSALFFKREKEGGRIMRVAQVAPLYESVPPKLYGGTERVVSYLTEEFVREGHDVTLYASGDSVTTAELRPICEHALRLKGSNVTDPTRRPHTNARDRRSGCKRIRHRPLPYRLPPLPRHTPPELPSGHYTPRPARHTRTPGSLSRISRDESRLDLRRAAPTDGLGELGRHRASWIARTSLSPHLR